MQIVIDIPEEIYKASKIIDVQYEDVVQIPLEVIANGTPLDNIRAEIEEQKECRCFDDDDMFVYITGLNDAIDIIDKYKAKSEVQDANSN